MGERERSHGCECACVLRSAYSIQCYIVQSSKFMSCHGYIHTIKRHKQHKTGNENDKSEGRERFGNGKNVWVAPFNSSDNTYIGVMLRAHMFQVGE